MLTQAVIYCVFLQMVSFDSTLDDLPIVDMNSVRVQVPSTRRLLIDNFTYSFKQVRTSYHTCMSVCLNRCMSVYSYIHIRHVAVAVQR